MSASSSSSAACDFKKNHQNVENLIKVKLKKPKSWNWELCTSKSSSSIQFPEIQLYDHKNNFLASANDANLVISNNITNSVPKNLTKGNLRPTKLENISPRTESTNRKHYPINKDVREFIDELTTQINRNGYECLLKSQNNKDHTIRNDFTNVTSSIPMSIKPYVHGIDISDGKNFLQITKRPQTEPNDHIDINIKKKNVVAIKKSKSTTAVVNMQTVDPKKGENIKKKYRRTYSANSSMRFSSSILERLSVNKQCSSSSTDTQSNYADKIPELSQDEGSSEYKPPNYVLRSSHAGTLVVCKDSFLSHGKLRRRTNTNNKEHLHNRQREKKQRRKDQLENILQNERNDVLPFQSDVNTLKATQRREIRRILNLHPKELDSLTKSGEYTTANKNNACNLLRSKSELNELQKQ